MTLGIEGFSSESSADYELRLLVFKIMDVRMGLDMEQVDEMIEPEQAKRINCQTFRLEDAIRFCGKKEKVYDSPKVVLIKDPNETIGVLIDQPEDIVIVDLSLLRPFPPLLQAQKFSDAIWAVAFVREEPALLLDLFRLRAALNLKEIHGEEKSF